MGADLVNATLVDTSLLTVSTSATVNDLTCTGTVTGCAGPSPPAVVFDPAVAATLYPAGTTFVIDEATYTEAPITGSSSREVRWRVTGTTVVPALLVGITLGTPTYTISLPVPRGASTTAFLGLGAVSAIDVAVGGIVTLGSAQVSGVVSTSSTSASITAGTVAGVSVLTPAFSLPFYMEGVYTVV